jgi:hypothetical protein
MKRAPLIAATLFALASLALSGSTFDDAYIFSRYAQNLLDYRDLFWNPGEPRVEGFTSWAWLLVHALGLRLGLHPVGFARLVGVLAGAACAGLVVKELLRDAALPAALVFGAMVACSPDAWLYASSGMDAPLWALAAWLWLVWFARGERLNPAHVVAAGALLLVRPEAIALLALCGLRAAAEVVVDRSGLRRAGLALAGLVVPAALLALRWAAFGQLVSNSVAAKHLGGNPLARLVDGVLYLADAGGVYLVPAGIVFALAGRPARPPLAQVLASRPARTLAAMVSFTALTLAMIALAGGDDRAAFPHARLLVPALGPLAYVLARAWPERAFTRAAAALGVAALLLGFLPRTKDMLRSALGATNMRAPVLRALIDRAAPGPSALSQFFVRETPLGEHIALPWAGRIPYETRLLTIDLLGLNDPHIASLPPLQRGIDVKYDAGHVLARRPYFICESITLPRPTREIAALSEAELYAAGAWKVGQRALLHDPRFAADYEYDPRVPLAGQGTCFRRRN